MNSFLKFSRAAGIGYAPEWELDPTTAFRSLSPENKAFFVLDQAVVIHYLNKLFDHGLPKLLRDMEMFIINTYLLELNSLCTISGTSKRIHTIHQCANYLLGKSKTGFNGPDCIAILNSVYTSEESSLECPKALAQTFYTSYLSYVHSMAQVVKTPDEITAKALNFSWSPASIPYVRYTTSALEVSYDLVSNNYSFDLLRTYAFAQKGMMPTNTIYGYFSGYDWSETKFSGVIGVLAAQCLEFDLNAIPKGSGMLGFYDVYRKTIQFEAPTDQSTQLAQSSDLFQQRRRIIAFIIELRERYGVIFDDASLLTKYINDKHEDADKLRDFLEAKTPAEVSVEAYQAFKRSVYSKFSELDILKMDGQFTLVNKAAKSDKPDASQDDSEDPDSKSTKSKKKISDDGTAPGSDEVNEDQDADKDVAGGQDPSKTTLKDAGDTSTQTDDDEPNTEETAESSDSDIENDQNTHTQDVVVPELPKLSDKRGVRLSLSMGESTDTVLYKMELESFVDSLLANPPPYLSVQTLSALKFVKTRWVHLLSAQSSYDMISRMIKVPRTMKPKKQ